MTQHFCRALDNPGQINNDVLAGTNVSHTRDGVNSDVLISIRAYDRDVAYSLWIGDQPIKICESARIQAIAFSHGVGSFPNNTDHWLAVKSVPGGSRLTLDIAGSSGSSKVLVAVTIQDCQTLPTD